MIQKQTATLVILILLASNVISPGNPGTSEPSEKKEDDFQETLDALMKNFMNSNHSPKHGIDAGVPTGHNPYQPVKLFPAGGPKRKELSSGKIPPSDNQLI